jgi:hypothetical protein
MIAAASALLAGAAQAASLTPIPSYVDPNGGVTGVLGLNDAGWMTGVISEPDGSSLGFLRDPSGVYTTFSDGFGTVGRGINAANDVTGYATDSTFNLRTDTQFLRTPGGAFTTLVNPNTAAPLNGIAQGINSAGVIVGDYYVPGMSHEHHGYILDGGSFTDLAIPGSPDDLVEARGVNDSGTVVGYAGVAGVDVGFIYSGGTFTFVSDPNPLAVGTFFEGLNNNGLIVGFWQDAGGDEHALEFDSGADTFRDFNVPGAMNAEAFGVNDIGEVTINTDIASGPSNFLYNPGSVPEPAAWGVMLLGLSSVGAALRRRARA